MIDIFKRRKSDRRPLWHYFQKMHCKNDSLESWDPPARTSHVLPLYCPLPCLSTLALTSTTICVPAVAFSVVRQANWVNFVIWLMSTGSSDQSRLIFMCVQIQSQDFNLVKGCGIYFPKRCPNSVLLSFSCLLGLRWLLNALNYAGSLCISEHLCVIQIMGGHRAWLPKQLPFQNGEIPRGLTVHRVWGAEERLDKGGTFLLTFHCAVWKCLSPLGWKVSYNE